MYYVKYRVLLISYIVVMYLIFYQATYNIVSIFQKVVRNEVQIKIIVYQK